MRLVSYFYESNVFILEKNNEVLIVDCGIPASEIKKHIGNKKGCWGASNTWTF